MYSNLIRYAYITLTYEDSKNIAYSQVESMDKVANAQMIYPYGLYANAPPDSMVLLFGVQGNEENLAGIPYSMVGRFKGLKAGEVLLGNILTQTYIKLDDQGNIEIDSKKDINVNVSGNVSIIVSGNATISASEDVNILAGNVSVNAPFTVEGTNAVSLGTGVGAKAIARTGDAIQVIISGTPYTGVITGGGDNLSN